MPNKTKIILGQSVTVTAVIWVSFAQAAAPAVTGSASVSSGTSANVSGSMLESPQVKSPEACLALEGNAERLSCYDSLFGRVAAPVAVVPEATTTAVMPKATLQPIAGKTLTADSKPNSLTDSVVNTVSQLKMSDLFGAAPAFDPSMSLLDRRWELSDKAKLGTFSIRPYKPVYILPVIYTGHVNKYPQSPNPDNQVSSPLNIQHAESKFELSLKTKAIEGLFGDYGDVWLGYTQSSRWQVYNSKTSRPFRETNYEPEASLMFATNYNLLGLNSRLLGVSLDHQSNGRSLPLSRSWNRVILNWGLERDNFALMIRPWVRLPEQAKDDDNRDIQNYMGRGDVQAFYRLNENEFSLMLRHSLRSGEQSHGAAQFEWAFPIKGSLRGYMQIFNGYGESMIDYNHRATYVGLGVSMVNWY